MKAIRNLVFALTTLCVGALPQLAGAAAYTSGTASFNVTLSDPSGNYNRRVDAYWVTDDAGNFVQTARYDAGTRRGYLYQWNAARPASWPYNAPIDGTTGATITSWGAYTVTWDGRTTNDIVVPDGYYKFYVEMTDHNGQGQWTTNGIRFYKGITNFNQTYPDISYITAMSVGYVPSLAYDIAVTGISPSAAIQNTTVPVVVTVTNKTSVPETFTLTLSNLTSSALIGTQLVTAMAGNTASNFTVSWNTTGLALGGYNLRAIVSAVAGETNTADNIFNSTINVVAPTHDVAVAAIAVPPQVAPGSLTNVTVSVTNKGGYTETFSVVLTDATEAKAVGTNQVSNLASLTGTTVTILWTVSTNMGVHTLRAVAGPVASETATADNTNSLGVLVTPPPVVTTYLTKSNYWRYSDTGTDLGTAWLATSYNDSAWVNGRGPLGYGDPPLNTTLSYGTDANNKYLTYYFRAGFNITGALPTNLTINLRRDDGAVIYHNGVEVLRTNMPTGTVAYTTLATAAIGGADETNYITATIPVTNAVFGTNVIAVEMHQNATNSSDLSFDLELIAISPAVVPSHDVAARTIALPSQAVPGTRTNVTVTVANQGSFAESFAVVLTDVTDAKAIGTNQVSNLATNATTNLVFPWDVPAVPFVTHTLRAVAGPVAGEVNVADNTNTIAVLVSPLMETNLLIVRSNFWRYNDTATDLTFTPWKQLDYYDDAWALGQGSLGYGDPHTTVIRSNTPPSTDKLPCYYFRKSFSLDTLPTAIILRLRRDDGAVVYHNGIEVHRVNVTNNPVYYTNWASATVDAANETTYFETNLPVTNAVVGQNVIAVEVHQVNATSSDISFDLELLGVNPVFVRVHDVAAIGLATSGDVLAGDRLPVTITLTNRGNVTETALLVLKDAATGQVIGTQSVASLVVGGSTTVQIDWATLGATNGTHSLQAFTVIGGVTNFAGATTGPATVSGSGFGLNAASAAGSVGGRCGAVAASANLLLVGAGATLEVWDRTAPSAPVKVGSVRLPGLIEDIVTSGSFAYAACGGAGVQFVNISTPSAPVHVNTFNSSGHATRLAISAGLLYVADGVAGLRIVNISAPATPSLAGAYYTAGASRAVAVSGATAYLLDGHSGLLILNVANPAAPTLLGTCAGLDAGQGLAISGSTAYVVDANNHFFVVNVATPSAPTLVNPTSTFLLTNLVAQSLTLNGTTAYVPAGEGGLAILNVATPAAPVFVGAIATPGQAVAVALATTNLYLADGFHGFQVFNTASPANPVLQSDAPTGLRACDVVVNSNLAYVAAGEGGFRIYGVTNQAAPLWLGWSTNALNARCVALSGTTAYVGDGQYGLKILNVAVPAAPVLLGSWSDTNLSSIRNLGVSGSLVVASDGRQVCLFDASAPASPVLRANFTAPTFAYDMTVAGTRAYLACGNAGFIILDISPTALTQRSVTDTAGLTSGISVSGTTAYVADGTNGWLAFDVSNPVTPALLKANSAQGPVSAVAVSGVLAALGNGANVIATMDVTAPLTPVTRQAFAGLVRSLRLASSGGRTYASEDEAGLAILASAEDSDGDGLPDSWEQQIVDANPNDNIRTIADVNPNDDFDHDGVINRYEYLAGTDATNPASRFMAAVTPPASGGSATVSWSSVAGKTYTVHKATNLVNGFSVLQATIPATPPLNTFTDPNPGSPAFYIISVP